MEAVANMILTHPRNLKLGKLAPKIGPRAFRMAKYMRAELPAPPDVVNYANGVAEWGMMGNEKAGDCTCAAAGHMIECWTANAAGVEHPVIDSEVMAAYVAVTGIEGAAYDPLTGDNDNGCAIADVLDYWRKTGIGDHQIAAHGIVDPTNLFRIQQALWMFGGLDIGVNMPKSAQAQVGGVWDIGGDGDNTPGSWGGHAIPLVGYDGEHFTCVTWGALQQMTVEWFSAYCDEAHAVISQEWIDAATAKCPAGFDLDTLLADLQAL